MANSPITIRFTDEIYATRIEVAKTLGTNLIDPLWDEIIKYRNSKKQILSIVDVTHSNYFLTLTDNNAEQAKVIEESLERFKTEFNNLLGGEQTKLNIKKELLKTALRNIAKINNIEFSDNSLEKVIDHKSFEVSLLPIARYLEALEKLNQFGETIDQNFLVNALKILKGENELSSFYRTIDIDSKSSHYLISKEYDAAPAKDINFLMSSLFDFINDKDQSAANKIAASIYMFEYAKPFDYFNKEICFLVIKRILCSDFYFLPLENILINPILDQICKEVQKSKDLTYLFIPTITTAQKTLIEELNKVIQINGHDLKQGYEVGDDKDQFQKEFGFEPPENVMAPKINLENETKKEEPISKLIFEKQKSVDKKPEVNTTLIKATLKTQIKSQEEKDLEKTFRKKANELLELDPYLKKSQAHFYVRHCTIGKFYTIQQFKKEERCVYETARTSMDNLVKLGYYKREQIKNKFVYTPIDK